MNPATSTSPRARPCILAIVLWWSLTLAGTASSDLSGAWVVDLNASDSLQPLSGRLHASWWRRWLMDAGEATYRQNKDQLTIVTGPFLFLQVERLRLDGQPQSKNVLIASPCTQRTFWSADGKQLISTTSFQTAEGKEARLRVARQLADGGQNLVIMESLDVTGELPPPLLRRVWRRRP
ncbi:MAG TPA: hypothetical protein VGD78_01055 [Chthoniobacterales bacterium]